MNHYEAKQEARRERLLARAEKLDRISAARFKAASAEVAGIPFGQPILVGHHSERRHRAALAKHDSHMRKAIEAEKAAARARGAAESVGSAGISSDDPDAPDKLREKLAKLEATQATMVAANKAVREARKWKVEADYKDPTGQGHTIRVAKGNGKANVWGHYMPGEEALAESAKKAAMVSEFKGLGLSEATILKVCTVPAWGSHYCAFEGFQLSNNNANIKRVKDRIAHLERAATREHKEVAVGNTGIKLVQNVEENRLQIIFPGKPDADVRAKLKASGFRWSPTSGAWQRHLGNSAIWAAEAILKDLRGPA